ncbi:MAG TPA: DNA replication/repair protein RecF [Blastocatellia bacterium]|nr:DNA replication/repair protein RecF [Blastocatellia bacterium]
MSVSRLTRSPCYHSVMLVDRMEVINFRNLEGSLRFGPGHNIFYGDNAQGKTNWLEALYLVGTTKSFRTKQLRDLIRFGAGNCIVRAEVSQGALTKQQQILVSETSKEMYVNGKREAVTRYLGSLDVVVFSMEGMAIVRGEPGERRRFLDRGILSITPSYLGTLSEYNHVIKQKNRLLAEAAASNAPEGYLPQVEAWNEQLIGLGTEIHNARNHYVARLNQVLGDKDQGRAIFGGEGTSVRYRSQLEGKGDLNDYAKVFRERLEVRMEAELASGHSLLGPHRDELEILIDGREAARFGSAGQQRSALFILDLAQVYVYNCVYEESPVLLIDDIDAELDRGRIEAVLSELEGRVQTFISTSRRGIANRYQDRANVYLVERGQVPGESRPLAHQDAASS